MGIFKDWFLKQDKKHFPDSKPEEEEKEYIRHEDLKAYIVVGCDGNGDNFVSCNFAPQFGDEMTSLIFLIASGGLMEELVTSLREACSSDEEAQEILQKVTANLKAYEQVREKRLIGQPAIRPTEVFRQGDRNELKG